MTACLGRAPTVHAARSPLFQVALLLTVPTFAGSVDGFDDEEPVRDVPKVAPPDPLVETEAQFGLQTRSERRWRRERPTEHNVDSCDEVHLIALLSHKLHANFS